MFSLGPETKSKNRIHGEKKNKVCLFIVYLLGNFSSIHEIVEILLK